MSSLPSDHATMFFSLATGILLISRPWGIIAVLHAIVFVMFPRVYLGIHYVTDILAGAALGAVVTWVALRAPITRVIEKFSIAAFDLNPGIFYAAIFLVSLELATMCESLQAFINYIIYYSNT